jgi:hypothetical protein
MWHNNPSNKLNKRPLSTLSGVNRIENYHNPETRGDVIIQASQEGLFQEVNPQEPESYDLEEHTPVVSNVIKDQSYLEQFQKAKESEEVTILDYIDHPDYDMNYENVGVLELYEGNIPTRSDLTQ